MTAFGFCTRCGAPAEAEALRCGKCGALLPMRDDPHDPRRLARSLAATLGEGYEVLDEVGRGGFSRVFRVRDLALARVLAVKVIAPELMTSQDVRERFRREVLTVARLVHPNIVPIYFVPGESDLACFVMPLVEGESLSARLRREGALPLAVAAGIAQDVAAALDVAHESGVVHRDVKPENILLEAQSGRALLSDFGIAFAPQPGHRLTVTGQLLGTPHYVAPEQGAGEKRIDGRADVYSLGVVVFEMVAGHLPFEAPTAQALVAQHLVAVRPDVRRWRPETPAPIAAAIDRALSQAPQDRFPTAGEFAAALVEGLGRRSLRASEVRIGARATLAGEAAERATEPILADARASLVGAADLAAFRDMVAAAQVSLGEAVKRGDGRAAADLVAALGDASVDDRPPFRQEAATALRACSSDRGVVECLARLWLGGLPGSQSAAEHALVALMPDAAPALLAVARRERRPEALLLADRTGALGDAEALALARDPSPGLPVLLVSALVESQREPEAVERWLAEAMKHPRPEVRRAALAAALQRGGALAERLGRAALADGEEAVRIGGIDALGASRRKEAVPDLVVLLEGGGEPEQLRAAEALGHLSVAEAVPPLARVVSRRKLLSFKVAPLEEAAVQGLVRIPGPEASAALDEVIGRGGSLGTLARRLRERRDAVRPRGDG